jgi:hypothetical protein
MCFVHYPFLAGHLLRGALGMREILHRNEQHATRWRDNKTNGIEHEELHFVTDMDVTKSRSITIETASLYAF